MKVRLTYGVECVQCGTALVSNSGAVMFHPRWRGTTKIKCSNAGKYFECPEVNINIKQIDTTNDNTNTITTIPN